MMFVCFKTSCVDHFNLHIPTNFRYMKGSDKLYNCAKCSLGRK